MRSLERQSSGKCRVLQKQSEGPLNGTVEKGMTIAMRKGEKATEAKAKAQK